MQLTPVRRALLTQLAEGFAERGVPVLVLRGPNLPERDGTRHGREAGNSAHDMALLVREADASGAREVLERTAWRFQLGDRGPWRICRTATYLYDDLLAIALMWGIPGAPLPFRRLRALERELWASAKPGAHGFPQPEAEELLVFLCSQGARLGLRRSRRNESWFEHIAVCASQVTSWSRVRDIARTASVEESVRRGLEHADVRPAQAVTADRPSGLERALWSTVRLSQRHARPRPLRAYVAAAPRLSHVTARVSFAGVVLEVGRGVFVPRALGEAMVEEALRALASASGVMVDVGTGCGPVALAVAARMPGVEVHGTEISRRALRWAARNRRRLKADRVRFHRGSILDPLPARLAGRVAVVTTNLPYVPMAEWQAGWQGRESQVVGSEEDGLGLYRRLVKQSRRFLVPGGRLIMQLENYQWAHFAEEIRGFGFVPGDVLRQWGNDVVVWAAAGENGRLD